MPKLRHERVAIAQKRLLNVPAKHGAALARTLEQKISDAGPFDQRIDPHILNPTRNEMVESGQLQKLQAHGVDWYALASADPAVVNARIEEQFAIYRLTLESPFNSRLGSVLEIAVYRALRRSALLSLGGYRDLADTPTTSKTKKEEPPSIFAGKELSGNKRFDFLVGHGAQWAGLEVKNIREWLYPNRDEIKDLFLKSDEISLPGILVGRRIPYVTRRLLHTAGFLTWETRRQYYPPEHDNLAGQVRNKTSLGYFDIYVSDRADAPLEDFIGRIIAEDLPEARERFDAYRDLVSAFGRREMSYKEFAARLRRREKGQNEDADELEEDTEDIPF